MNKNSSSLSLLRAHVQAHHEKVITLAGDSPAVLLVYIWLLLLRIHNKHIQLLLLRFTLHATLRCVSERISIFSLLLTHEESKICSQTVIFITEFAGTDFTV